MHTYISFYGSVSPLNSNRTKISSQGIVQRTFSLPPFRSILVLKTGDRIECKDVQITGDTGSRWRSFLRAVLAAAQNSIFRIPGTRVLWDSLPGSSCQFSQGSVVNCVLTLEKPVCSGDLIECLEG